MKALANRWEISERETEDQNRNEVIAFEEMNTGTNKKHGGKRQNVSTDSVTDEQKQNRDADSATSFHGHYLLFGLKLQAIPCFAEKEWPIP